MAARPVFLLVCVLALEPDGPSVCLGSTLTSRFSFFSPIWTLPVYFQYVSEVVIGAPYAVTADLLDHFRVGVCDGKASGCAVLRGLARCRTRCGSEVVPPGGRRDLQGRCQARRGGCAGARAVLQRVQGPRESLSPLDLVSDRVSFCR